MPNIFNTDKASTYGKGFNRLKYEGKCPIHVQQRQIKYLNNWIECDHGKLKRIIHPMLDFKSLKTAYATLKGIGMMWALRKGQTSPWYFSHPLGEVRLVNQVFGHLFNNV